MLNQVIDGLHPFGGILDRLPGEHIEGFEGRHEIGDREELFHFLRSNDDILAATLEKHAVESARDKGMAVAAGHQEGDHLGLELDLSLEPERGHLRVACKNLSLRAGYVLHLITELSGTRGSLAERFALGRSIRTGVIGRLDIVRPVNNNTFLHFAQGIQLGLGDLDLAELLLHNPDLLDL